MKREEAVGLLKEIVRACEGLGGQAVMLTPPNAEDVLSIGVSAAHIKTA